MHINGWLNIYKNRGISSAHLVAKVRHVLSKQLGYKVKIGHTGTLDPEAEGILPLAIGEATKLTNILIDAKKEYEFIIKFGEQRDTGDIAGEVVATSEITPSRESCIDIIDKFTGDIEQIPPKYSALKVNGVRAYKLAREQKDFNLSKRSIHIYELLMQDYDAAKRQAQYRVTCSKGTYIRTLSEDIALALQSVGFVLELRRTRVGIFEQKSSFLASDLEKHSKLDAYEYLLDKVLKIDYVLDDIPVFDIDESVAQKVRFGQKIFFEQADLPLVCLKYADKIVAMGEISQNMFLSSRGFNL